MSTTSSSNMAGFWELLVLSVRQRMCEQKKQRMKKEKNYFVECITTVIIMTVSINTEDLQMKSIFYIIAENIYFWIKH